MSKRTLRTQGLCAASLAGALFVAQSSSAACDDKAIFLSKEYLTNKGDCAVNAAIDAGKGLLYEAGKTAAKAAMNYFLPGVGDFFFGGAPDPFAEHAAKIINEIQATKVEIMRAIVDQALIADGASWDSIVNRAADWANPFYDVQTRIDNIDNLESIIADLNLLRNRFETTNYGVWNLSAYSLAVQLELSLKADRETLRMYDQGQREGETPEQIMANTQGAVAFVWSNMLNGSGQVFSYVNSLTMSQFNAASDSRFSLVFQQVPFVANLCPFEVAYRKYNVKTTAHPTMSAPSVLYEVGLNASGCPPISGFGMYSANTTSYLWTGAALASKTHLGGSNSTGSVWQFPSGAAVWSWGKAGVGVPAVFTPQPSVNTSLMTGYNKHLQEEQQQYFVAGYGAMRPLLDKWKDAIGEGLNDQPGGLDTSIKNYLAGFPAFTMTQGYFFALALGSTTGTPAQQRWSEDYVLTNGVDELMNLLGTTSIDTMGLSTERYDSYLRNYTSASDAAADQYAYFTSKIISAVLM